MKLAVISSGLQSAGSSRPTYAAQQAAEKIGWQVTIYNGNNEQLKDLAAVNAAVDAKSNAIILVLIDPDTIASAVQKALNAHIAVATVGVPSYIGHPGQRVRNAEFDSIPDESWDFYEQGQILGDYIVWKSDAHAVAYTVDVGDYPAIHDGQTAGVLSILQDKSKCPDCVTQEDTVSVTANSFSQTGSLVQAAVEKNPKINWLFNYDSGLETEVNALNTAHLLGSIQGGGFDCNGDNLNFIKEGHGETVCIAESAQWAAYAAVDAVNRMMQGQKPYTAGYPAGVPDPGPNYTLPIYVVDSSNVNKLTSADLANGWQGGIDFRSYYYKIWGVG